MLLGLTLSGNPDATFGWADAQEFTGCSGWGPDFPEDNKNVDVEKENEEEVTLEEEEVARILLMLSRSGKFDVAVEAEDVPNTDDDDYVADDIDNLCYDLDYPYHEENTLSHPDSEPEEQSPDLAISTVTSEEEKVAPEREEELTLEQSAKLLLLIAQSDEYEVIFQKRKVPTIGNNDNRLDNDPCYNHANEEEEEDPSGFWNEPLVKYFLHLANRCITSNIRKSGTNIGMSVITKNAIRTVFSRMMV